MTERKQPEVTHWHLFSGDNAWTRAEKFARAVRIHRPDLRYLTQSRDAPGGAAREYLFGFLVPVTDAEISDIEALANPGPPKDAEEARARRLAELTDALNQMRSNGLYRRYPGRVAQIKEQIRALGKP